MTDGLSESSAGRLALDMAVEGAIHELDGSTQSRNMPVEAGKKLQEMKPFGGPWRKCMFSVNPLSDVRVFSEVQPKCWGSAPRASTYLPTYIPTYLPWLELGFLT